MNQKLLLLIVCLVIIVDQATKTMAREFGATQLNPGIAFGLLSEGVVSDGEGAGGGNGDGGRGAAGNGDGGNGTAGGWQGQFWSSSILGILFIVLLFAYLNADFYTAIGFGLFLGGAFSNGIDRAIWGGVQDWVPLPLVQLHNNLADVAIAIGVLVLIYAGYEKIRLSHPL